MPAPISFRTPTAGSSSPSPMSSEFTLIGTTDVDFTGEPGRVAISPEETDYLCRAASEYFSHQVTPADVVSSYAGIRPLFDDGRKGGQGRHPRLCAEPRQRRQRGAPALDLRRQDHHLQKTRRVRPAQTRPLSAANGTGLDCRPTPAGRRFRPGPIRRCAQPAADRLSPAQERPCLPPGQNLWHPRPEYGTRHQDTSRSRHLLRRQPLCHSRSPT